VFHVTGYQGSANQKPQWYFITSLQFKLVLSKTWKITNACGGCKSVYSYYGEQHGGFLKS
jgi:hypothetical protein